MSKAERAAQAEAALMQHLAEYRDVYGPLSCPVHNRDEEACECDPEVAVEFGDLMLSEFIIGTAWTDMEDGESYFNYSANSGALLTHSIGLIAAVQMQLESGL